MRKFCFLLFCSLPVLLFGQSKEYKIGCIGFYNFENLFDTIDSPNTRDTEFTPTGSKIYGTAIYSEKLNNLAKVVSEIGTELTPDGVSLLGVAEIENRKVLEDFVQHPSIKSRNYQIVHFDSPDRRGIDVALLYQPKYFQVTASKPVTLKLLRTDGDSLYTRDILHVEGVFDGEPIHILVNHWPSRSGGAESSSYLREFAAYTNKLVVDAINKNGSNPKIIVMGDLNDDPNNISVEKILGAKRKKKDVEEGELFNPWYNMYRKGIGTLAYQDSWNLFDQIIVSHSFINKKASGYRFYQARIFNPPYMYQKTGQYKGYPFRTFGGDNYMGGYSDHFPVYIYLLKEK